MNFIFRSMRIISSVVLVFFLWTFGGVFDIAYAIKDSEKLKVKSEKIEKQEKPEGKFQKTIEDIEQALSDTSTDTDTKKNKVKGKKGAIDALDVDIRKQFADTEKKLKDAGLPYEILERHQNFVRHYEDNLKELKSNLDDIDRAKTKGETDAAIGRAKTHFEKVKPPKKHKPLDPNKLPHRTAEPVFKEPRTKPEEFEKEHSANGIAQRQKTILVASNGPLKGLLSSTAQDTESPAPLLIAQATNLPTPADLSETPEIQFTAELREIATLLENNPVLLYEFVRNNFEYEPYYGSLKGSQSTLLLQGGNDFDQASLLMALFRVSGIAARYVYGTVQIPIENLMKWVGGVNDPNTAATILATGSIPGKLLTEGGQIKYAQMEHVWVEVYVPYANYRGIPNEANGSGTWISLDPSFKMHEPNPSAIDVAELQNFNIDSYLTAYLQTVKPITPAKEYLTNTISYVKENLTGQSFYNLLASSSIIDKVLDLLPNSLPYPVTVIGSKFSTIPDTYRQHITTQLIDPNSNENILSYTAPWASLLHKRVTISYAPTTASDEQVIATYGGLYSTPPYLIRVKPTLKVEGMTVAEGVSVNMAYDLICTISLNRTGGAIAEVVTNIVTAGATFAIGLGAGHTTGRIVTYRAFRLEAAIDAAQSGESIVGEYLNLIAVNYLQELDSSRKMISKTMKIIDTNRMAELMVGVDVGISYIFDVPKAVSIRGLFIDVDYNTSTAIDMGGDQSRVRRFQILSGMTSSALEHTMFEATVGVEAISAIKALQVASAQGVTIHQIDASNILIILPALQLGSEVKADIQNAVHAGKVVIVSEQNVQVNDWIGVGYIVHDPLRGTGAYMINGLSGGSLTVVTTALQYLINSGDMTKDESKQYILSQRRQIWFPAPVEGAVFSKFGKRKSGLHYGVDFAARIGTPVIAVADGIVTRASDSDTYGKVVYIDHGAGVETRYAHNSELKVSGGRVSIGDIVAMSGNTGHVDPPPTPTRPNRGQHVHFEIRLNGEALDPESFDMWKY